MNMTPKKMFKYMLYVCIGSAVLQLFASRAITRYVIYSAVAAVILLIVNIVLTQKEKQEKEDIQKNTRK